MSDPNPLQPYAWELRYTNGHSLRRDSPGGPWTEPMVPLEGLDELLVHRDHGAPLRVRVQGPVAGVCFRTRGTITVGGGVVLRQRRWLIGLVDPAGTVDGWRITLAGGAVRYRGALIGW